MILSGLYTHGLFLKLRRLGKSMMEAEYHMVLDYEMECRKDFEKGNLTVDDIRRPEYMVSGVVPIFFLLKIYL